MLNRIKSFLGFKTKTADPEDQTPAKLAMLELEAYWTRHEKAQAMSKQVNGYGTYTYTEFCKQVKATKMGHIYFAAENTSIPSLAHWLQEEWIDETSSFDRGRLRPTAREILKPDNS